MFKNIVKVHYTTELEEKIKQEMEMKNISERNRQIYLSCPEIRSETPKGFSKAVFEYNKR